MSSTVSATLSTRGATGKVARGPIPSPTTVPPSGGSVADESLALVGRELHDGVAQDLWYLHFRLSSLIGQIPADCPELLAQLEEVKAVSQGAYEGLRKVLGSLKPQGRDSRNSVDLAGELALLKDKFAGALGLPVQLSPVPSGLSVRVSPQVAHQACMVVQEALWNAYRHSNAERVLVAMHQTETGAVVATSDNGQGFDPDQIQAGHYGLETMRRRAESIRGKLVITSHPGEGTRIVLHLPQERPLAHYDAHDDVGVAV